MRKKFIVGIVLWLILATISTVVLSAETTDKTTTESGTSTTSSSTTKTESSATSKSDSNTSTKSTSDTKTETKDSSGGATSSTTGTTGTTGSSGGSDDIKSAVKKAFNKKEDSKVIEIGSTVLGIVQGVGIAVSVIMLAVMATKFFLQSPGGKAEVLKQLQPYVIGVILIMGGTAISSILQICNITYI